MKVTLPIARGLMTLVLIATLLTPFGSGAPAAAANTVALANDLRISQVYGGGGGSTGYYQHDYVELFNAGAAPVNLTGWSLQYGSSTGNFASTGTNLYAFPANTIVASGQYLLVQLGTAGSGGIALPVIPDLVTTNLNMSATSGKVALANIATALGCGASATPCALPDARIVDLAAWGESNNAEGGVTINNGVALTNQQGGVRKVNGCQDTDHNGDDFDVLSGAALLPRNSVSPTYTCPMSGPAISLSKTVGTDPTACATTDNISVPAGTEVTYCYTVTNTGTVTLNYHDLEDSELGWILEEFQYTLAPSASVFVTETLPIYVNTVNSATWAAYNADFVDWVEATDVATVTVTLPEGAFCNLDTITIPSSGAATPYPSEIEVSGLMGTVTNVRVYLFDMNHTFPDDLDVLLVGPEGQNLIIMSDAGGSADLINVNLIFDDAASGPLPDINPIVSGVYLPTNYDMDDTFPAPAPAPSAATQLAVFNSTDPNGTWSLYVFDDASGDLGNINGGWCVQIETETIQEPPNINVHPLSLSSTQFSNQQASHTLTISNTGEADLTWAILEEPAAVMGRAMSGAARSQAAVLEGGARRAYTSMLAFSQGFDDITVLPGWFAQNNSAPLGSTDWFQGNSSEFLAHAGAPNAYIAADFNNTAGVGVISNWLLTPELELADGETFSFWTRTVVGSSFADRLELRLSLNGDSTDVGTLATDVGDFNMLLLEINPAQTVGGYPVAWTQYNVTLSGIPSGSTGRIAFRYFVTNAGPGGGNSNYIGIDTVEYTGRAVAICENPADVPWLSVSPTGGTIAGGAATSVQATFNSTLLAGGTYNANLCVFSNDPDEGPDNESNRVIVPVTLTVLEPAIVLTKTVGTVDGVCAGTSEITVPEGTTVYYCYTVTNTGNVTLNLHDLDDSELGNLLSGLSYALAPGASAFLTETTTINVTTVNTALWTAYNAGPTDVVTATDVATVTVEVPSVFACNAPAEGFDNGIPAGWSVQTNEPNGPQWSSIAGCGEAGNYTNGTGEAACVSSDQFGAAEMDTSLVTPLFSLGGFGAASLSYTANYQNFANLDFLDVDISADGGATWTTLLSWNDDFGAFRAQPGVDVTINLSAYAGQSGLMLRWRYYDPNTGDWNWYAQVDDVGLTCGEVEEEPNIDVDPLSMGSTQPANTTTQQTLDISNTGEADLTWMILEEPAAMLGRAAPGAAGSRTATFEGGMPLAYTSMLAFSEGFDDITALPGWYAQNNSAPLGLTNWFQGNAATFPAHAGATNAYIAANYNNTAGVGTISNWLLTPELELADGETFSFWTRVVTDGGAFPDRLEVRLSTNGASTNVGTLATDVGDFATLLLSVNPDLTFTGYPEVWTQFSVTLSGIPSGATGRFAFRYYVTNAGPSGSNSNYIGIDTVEYTGNLPPQICDLPTDVPWLAVSPTNGTTLGGATTPVDVTFDSTGLSAGTYNANLCVFSNDPDIGPGNETELVIVPVELVVTETLEPSILITKTVGLVDGVCADTTSLEVPAGTTVYYCYTVTNTGNVTLTHHDLVDDVLGPIFSDFNYVLAPGASVNTVAAGLSISYVANASVTNTGTWTATDPTGGFSATANASATVMVASIEIVKTVGTVDGVCAGTSEITVPEGTTVYYCYTVTNTGNVTLNLHDLDDSALGNLFTAFPYELPPGSSVNTVDSSIPVSAVIYATTVNTATWTAYNANGPSVTATATARVNVEPTAVSVTRLAASPAGGWSSVALLGVFALGGFTWKRKRR